jgi:hypothetical protein
MTFTKIHSSKEGYQLYIYAANVEKVLAHSIYVKGVDTAKAS